jgi:hypothetical protein
MVLKFSMLHIQNNNHSEHMATDEVTVLFKRKVTFKLDIQKKHKHFRIKIYKMCDTYGYTWPEVYLWKVKKRATKDMTATNATVKQLRRRVKGHDHKLYINNHFSSPELTT